MVNAFENINPKQEDIDNLRSESEELKSLNEEMKNAQEAGDTVRTNKIKQKLLNLLGGKKEEDASLVFGQLKDNKEATVPDDKNVTSEDIFNNPDKLKDLGESIGKKAA